MAGPRKGPPGSPLPDNRPPTGQVPPATPKPPQLGRETGLPPGSAPEQQDPLSGGFDQGGVASTDAPGEEQAPENNVLGDRDYVPVDEWQIDNSAESDIGSWGDRPLPTYTSDLHTKAEQDAAEARVRKQTDKVTSVAHLPADDLTA